MWKCPHQEICPQLSHSPEPLLLYERERSSPAAIAWHSPLQRNSPPLPGDLSTEGRASEEPDATPDDQYVSMHFTVAHSSIGQEGSLPSL